MVRIINGDIVPDNDPRVTGRGASQTGPGGGSAAAPAAASQASIFDWSAPPVRVVHPDPQGQGIAALPGLSIYGAPVTPTQLVMLLGAGLMLGLKGLLVGGIVWWIYTGQRAQQGAAEAQAAGAQQQQRVAAASNFFQSFMQQEPLGRPSRGPSGPVGHDGSQTAGAGGQAGQGQGRGSWQDKGKAYKLSG